ncbi:MAG TPA: DUF2130 domain-containing protein [Candidatus Alectryocaccobium stercorigallinarum]|nr:DUF2130 domain-containing protein [Candidatus Alectryocaccobium stercorigallinarum]
MHEIKCPVCGSAFSVDEAGYAQILQQVRNEEFERELKRREDELLKKGESDIKLSVMERQSQFDKELSKKDSELAEKDRAIAELKAKLESSGMQTQLAVSKAVQEKEKELSKQRDEISDLKNSLIVKDKENEINERSLKDQYEDRLKQKDELIEYYKDFKARQSTKMVGESLEQHCLNQFNAIRTSAFPNAYFEKDNDAKSGSKGDFIFRESDGGVEFISIMFEMKNEMDTTATKHKNEDFFKELDKDRREKKCEYAVLVSLLEADSDLYNNGIVDVSYRYEKMYVVRPQFFIPIITLLRNAALNSLQYKKELDIARSAQIDIRNFEENMNEFKDKFARNYRIASEKFQTAIDEIDKTITHLQKTKEALLSSENNLRLANNKAEELSIKRLTKNAPSVREMFDRE